MGSNHVLLNDEDTGYASYITDLGSTQLSETDLPEWVQALPVGTYRHPVFGKMVFDETTLNEFATNWRKNVRGQDLDIDLEHKQFNSEAAGWVTDLRIELNDPEPKNRGLWYKIDWTKLGVDKLTSKAYRYFSSDYFTSWTDPTGVTHKNVLNGGGLTNRPYLKGMKPIVLSEDDERSLMNREALERLAKSLGIEFNSDTTDAELSASIEAAAIASDDSDTANVSDETTQDDQVEADKELVSQLSEADLKNPAIQALLAERVKTAERLANLEQANKLSEINRQLGEIGNGKFVVIPKIVDQVRAVMLSSDEATGKAVLGIVNAMADKNAVRQLGEIGVGHNSNGTNSDANTLSDFEAAATKLAEDKKISYLDAIEQIAVDQPALYQSYMRAQYSHGGIN